MLPITMLRSSSVNTFNMCTLKYFLNYTLGWQEQSNKKADLGTVVHKVMEILAEIKLGKQNSKRKVSTDIIPKLSTNPSKVDINFIIDEVYNHYIKLFTHHEWTDADYKTVVKWVYKALNDYEGQFHPFNQTIVEAEKRFHIKLEDDWADGLILNGTIDLIIKHDDKTYEIVDYKTGKRKNWATGEEKTYSYLMNDFQLRLYHYAVSILYPEIDECIVTIYFINDGGPFTLPFSKDDLEETKKQIRAEYEQMKYLEKPEMQSRFFPTQWGSPCKFCEYAKKSFKGTNIQPIVNKGQTKCHFSKKGENMTMCEQTNYISKYRDMESMIANMSKEGHDSSYYKPPGEVA